MNAASTQETRGTPEEGFSLIELLVATLIIAILAAMAVPLFLGSIEQARSSAVQAAIANARLSVALVVLADGEVPTGEARTALLAEHNDRDIALNMTASGIDYCLSGRHALATAAWAATQDVVPTRGATCDGEGRIVLP